ncbi:alpha/beta fold hydrolase [Halomonas stenophila]|uniref:Pimeloyl-ACP methyl ester carboxylesterase n=1 Tax=Halomonas stenophila TaxID=795312 RepID=A0A7W5EWL6_9GAMM|nr:alpha/beta fold hydrolase [Halomonas stenophila]MBB3232802.1 pimeloyl-ACP methyl ester carboxylesterase [Halomonas stenophila]
MTVVDHQGLRIAFADSGAGLPIVLGHGFLCSGEMWREQVPVLAEHYRVINPDFRGHGRSGRISEPFTLYDAVSDVIAVLDELGIERAIWCGLSIGGMVALRGALCHPDRVAGLILMDTDAGAETAWHKVKYRAMGATARAFGFRPLLPSIAGLMFGATTRRENRALVDEWKARVAENHVPSMLLGLDALIRRDSVLDRLHEIGVPALVLVGEEDRSLPVALSRRIHARLPDSTLTVIPGAGHLAAIERPAQVNEAIAGFLAAQAK